MKELIKNLKELRIKNGADLVGIGDLSAKAQTREVVWKKETEYGSMSQNSSSNIKGDS